MTEQPRRPLWTCPKCGRRFVARYLWHSCGHNRLADHFEDKDPIVRKIFDRFRRMVQRCGSVEVHAQKTRIVFATRVRFAGAVTRKHSLQASLWLRRQAQHRTLQHIETYGPHSYSHYFKLTDPSDLDAGFAALVREAYAIGQQERPTAP